jgi:uncharacterized protein YdiU (UPF0061 family)
MTTQPHLNTVKLAELNFTNRLSSHCPFLFERVQSTPLKNPQLLHTNLAILSRLEIDPRELNKSSFTRFINADLDFDGLLFASTYYSGHQFGHYVPRLGDGRALMLGEIRSSQGVFFELQLKGAGLTPFSRMGDGKAVVRSSIREYLGSAHLSALGIPTTEALALIYGSDDVYREEIEKAAIVLRVSKSFLRFGHFQFFAHHEFEDELKKLVDFSIDHYFKEFSDHSNRYVLFFQSVIKKTAKLFAAWQAVGFCHGVLNTDNMSILGLTIDYGPFGFIDHLDLDHICNHSDHEGRYSFGNQPPIGLWNLEQLGLALKTFINEEDRTRTLATYAQIFHIEYLRLLKEKLGLQKNVSDDDQFIKKTLNTLVMTRLDYTQFFRELSHYQTTKKLSFTKSKELDDFLSDYEERLSLEDSTAMERQFMMLAVNPKFILRNYLAQIAIENYQENPEVLAQIMEVLTHPFDEWCEYEEWSKSAPPKYKNLSVSCSS